jgi:hypothetical protein
MNLIWRNATANNRPKTRNGVLSNHGTGPYRGARRHPNTIFDLYWLRD